ncbi:hypothetical protein DPMN_040242 [Dreissena polymorpha]|uniref:Uncharacterized protein n=1 Tax=Dreissena polymorpha TaxID=45954 RepID=A0A9D4HUU1_DREPO|nr:hypothetical protein DPMN_040242 [Dreissena polymorpha]
MYSRYSRVSQVLEAFQDTASCTVVTRGKVRYWKPSKTQQSVQLSLAGKSGTGSLPRHSSLYSCHSRVSQVLEAFQDSAVCTVVTRG